jgi:transposase InsO family protein
VSQLRFALCHAVRTAGQPVAAAARRFGVSRKTAHKWLRVFDALGGGGGGGPASPAAEQLADRSRRPRASPRRTADAAEAAILAARDRFNWGPRKIHHFLRQDAARRGEPPPAGLPASPRTVARVLARHGRVGPPPARPPAPADLQRFERAAPNQLWQVDFKGPVEVARRRVTPLAVLDDHSRYLLAFEPCDDRTMATAWAVLWAVFADAGLPEQVLSDGGFRAQDPGGRRGPGLGWFDARLIRLGVAPAHGRPYHPQTQGKVERLNGCADRELLYFDARRGDADHFRADCRRHRDTHNALRPHEAIGDVPPATRWAPSPRRRPADLPEADAFYPAGATLRTVGGSGDVQFRGYRVLCGRGITGQRVRVEDRDDGLAVFYCAKLIRLVAPAALVKGMML